MATASAARIGPTNISIEVGSQPILFIELKNGKSSFIHGTKSGMSQVKAVHIITPIRHKDEVHIHGKNAHLGDYEAELLPEITPDYTASCYPKFLSDELKKAIQIAAQEFSETVSEKEKDESGRWHGTIPMIIQGQHYNLAIEMW